MTPVTSKINTLTQYDFTINLSMPLPVGTTIRLQIPTQIQIVTSDGSVLVNSALGQSPLYNVIQIAVLNKTTQLIQLSNLVPTASYYVDEQTLIQFSLLSLRNPVTTAPTDKFSLSVYEQDYLIMTLDESGGFTLQASPGTLGSA